MGDNEAEIEKIKSAIVAILKDIKKDIEDATITGVNYAAVSMLSAIGRGLAFLVR